MKSLEKILKKLNNLLILNYEIENVYLEALDLAGDDHLKAFFRERLSISGKKVSASKS